MTADRLPCFPLSTVVFPHQPLALQVFEPRYRQLLTDIGGVGGRFGIVLIERGSEVGGADARFDLGTVVEVVQLVPFGDDRFLVLVKGLQRFQVTEWGTPDPYPVASVSCFGDHDVVDAEVLTATESAVRAVRNLWSEINIDDECHEPVAELDESPTTRAWQLCALSPMPTLDQLAVLRVRTMNERLRVVMEICCERYGDLQRVLQLPPTD